jgi:hypothetical protein
MLFAVSVTVLVTGRLIGLFAEPIHRSIIDLCLIALVSYTTLVTGALAVYDVSGDAVFAWSLLGNTPHCFIIVCVSVFITVRITVRITVLVTSTLLIILLLFSSCPFPLLFHPHEEKDATVRIRDEQRKEEWVRRIGRDEIDKG